ncbi:MAG: copper-binding protein [Gallionellaceae bacterium]
MKVLNILFLLLSTTLALSPASYAQEKVEEMSKGEIRKIDKATKKITIKHGEIKNLDMPGMTRVFQVKDHAMLDNVKPGVKVKFSAERSGGAIVVTDIKPDKQ